MPPCLQHASGNCALVYTIKLAVSIDCTISIFLIVDNEFLGQLASLFLHIDAEDRSLLRDVPETDVWLMAMKHCDASTDQLKMSNLPISSSDWQKLTKSLPHYF